MNPAGKEKLRWIARRIEADLWSKEFIKTLDTKTIPDIADQLTEVRKVRDEWLEKVEGGL